MARVTVAPPVRAPHRFGLFSVAAVSDVTDMHELMGVQWQPLPCERPKLWRDPCFSGDCGAGESEGEGESGGEKEFVDQPGIAEADPITVYGSFECQLLGWSPEEAQARARAHLTAGEQQAVEYAVWTGEGGNCPNLSGPDTVNLGTAGCAEELLALLYDYADTTTVGEPVIHAPRPALAWLEDQVVRESSRLTTRLGTPIAAGAGYTEANTAAPGSWWVYVTGPVMVRRGPVEDVPNPAALGFNTKTNEYVALAERQYVVGWDCPAPGAVLFTPRCSG